jgi:hypothetical protein
VVITLTNDNYKDIKIETGEDVGKDEKIKAGVKALAKKPFRETSAEYKADSQ